MRSLKLGLARGLVLGYALGEITIAVGTEWVRASKEILATGLDLGLDAAADVFGTDDPREWFEERRAAGAVFKVTVGRGHCQRCDRCGWQFGAGSAACRIGSCSMRPLPEKRTTCAGCGVPFVDAGGDT